MRPAVVQQQQRHAVLSRRYGSEFLLFCRRFVLAARNNITFLAMQPWATELSAAVQDFLSGDECLRNTLRKRHTRQVSFLAFTKTYRSVHLELLRQTGSLAAG